VSKKMSMCDSVFMCWCTRERASAHIGFNHERVLDITQLGACSHNV